DSAWTSLRSFKPLPHRLEIFHRWRGITFVDDSKSTTPSSTLEAVFSFHDPVRLILGGRGKGADFHVLRAMKKRDVLEIFVIGETREILIDTLGDIFPVTSADSLQEATALAIRHAKSGDVILLSPACASFDMFESFKARGEAFKSAVQQIAA
ncbi:MAG: UDP-N-acetylmuramoyl-L-alanine--D-glutamate ligase, partial [Candidatus Aureabacteria bacterium]|nr:UDP-N-acetylmuramoyl-L-alanine--D-glutamate ligase [Candidatus Auribacterota bacterium]